MAQNIGSWIRAKWGRFCLLLFALGMAIAIFTASTTRPSSQYGAFEFFAQREGAAKGVIRDVPPQIRLLLDKGETLEIDPKNSSATSLAGIKVASSGADLIIQGVSFTMAEKVMQERWHSPLTVRSLNGGVEVDYDLDARLVDVHRIYEVKDNVINRHYYRLTQLWGVLLVLIGMPVVYIIGKVVIMILNRRAASVVML